MSSPLRERLKARLRPEEGFRAKRYFDSRGVPTIGEGFNLTRPDADALLIRMGLSPTMVRSGTWAITFAQAEELLDYCAECAITDAGDVVGHETWEGLPDDAKLALSDMCYQMGGGGLAAFRLMIAAVRRVPPDWLEVKRQMNDSAWDGQTPARADGVEALIDALIPVITPEDRARVAGLFIPGRPPAGAHASDDVPPESSA